MGILEEKYARLLEILRGYGSAAVAFSGGVDSTLLLAAAREALGANVLAVTAVSEAFPEREFKEAEDYCRENGIRQVIVRTRELDIPGFCENRPDRCYLCKKDLFSHFLTAAEDAGMAVVCEGSNLDDNGDYRPGHIAIKELGIKSPLRDAELTKADIRGISKMLGLKTWSKPSYACLASRFVYGEPITAEKLSMVDQAERLLQGYGFTGPRVRIHGRMARIEVIPGELERLVSLHQEVAAALHGYGFSYVSMDLDGYRTGSMNEVLTDTEKLHD